MKPRELNYLHISIYFTIVKCAFFLFKAGVDGIKDGGIWDLLTAGRIDKKSSDRTTVTQHWKTTEHNIVKIICKVQNIILK